MSIQLCNYLDSIEKILNSKKIKIKRKKGKGQVFIVKMVTYPLQ